MTADFRTTSRRTGQVVVGLLVVAFGLLLTADNLGWMNARAVLRYWPLVIVALGAWRVVSSDRASGRVSGGMVMLVGALLAADQVYRLPARIWDWWPLLLIAAGVLLVFRSREGEVPATTDRDATEFAFWSGVRRRIATPNFRRADLTAVMGGIELDLRQAATGSEPAVVDVFVMMGGVDIKVPPDWDVSNQVVAVMGGAADRSAGTKDARKRLIVRGLVIMGGVEIKN